MGNSPGDFPGDFPRGFLIETNWILVVHEKFVNEKNLAEPGISPGEIPFSPKLKEGYNLGFMD